MKKNEIWPSLSTKERSGHGFHWLKAGLVFLCLLSLPAFGRNQLEEKKLSLKLSDVTLSEFFNIIESKSDFVFIYNDAQIDPNSTISLNASDETVEEILKEVLGDVSFKFYDNQVVIKKNETEEALTRTNEVELDLLSQQQTKKVSGNVTDKSGYGIPGVNVSVKGTTNGTITNIDGAYTLEVNDDAILVFSFIGFISQEVPVVSTSTVNVVLEEEVMSVDEVVVTALGIKREKKALGYAAAEVGAEAFDNAKDANVMGALSGRLAGVQINTTGQGAGGSSSVIIRGSAVLSKSNEPLYVVDGVPISNTQFSNADDSGNGGIDSGNGLSGIAADDIENVSVLKGPAATALYGSRAINGVVLVTTKSGKGEKGTSVEFNSNFTLDMANIASDWQSVYGQGLHGKAPQTQPEGDDNTSMWGAKYSDVDTYINYRGDKKSYKFYDNEKDFYDLGMTWSNSIAVTHNGENSNVRLSYSNTTNDGMVPHTSYDRNTLNLAGGTKAFDDKLEINAKISYTKEESTNAMMGSTPFNPTSQLLGVPNNVSLADLKDYKDAKTGLPVGLGSNNSNPYWTLNEIDHAYTKNRVMTLVNAKYNFTDYISAQVRGGSDMTFYGNESVFPIGTPYYETGRANMTKAEETESNYDFLLTYDRNFTDMIGITVNGGASRMDREYESVCIFSDNFSIPTLQRPGYGTNNTQEIDYSKKRINSVYGTAQFRYGNFWYVDVTARNDWSSTLPSDNNSYFYPSVSSSVIISDLVEMPSWMSFAKVRGSWAQVGSDTDPYELALLYNLDSNAHPGWGGNNIIAGGIDGEVIPNAVLKPSIMTSYELGADMKFFNNRVGMDITYYNSIAEDQIMPVTVSSASGYGQAIVNSGSIENKGFEVSLYATPYKTSDFSWNTTVNFSKNSNEVVSLADGVKQLELLSGAGVNVIATVGKEYGTIMGSTYQRDEKGEIKLDENGLPMPTNEYSALGCGYHDIMLGWVNTFSYKNLTMNIVLDSKFGGEVYSATEASAYSMGKHKNTLERKEYTEGGTWYPSELEGKGTTAKPNEFYGAVASIDEEFIYDASYVSFKELSVSYRFPAKFFKDSKYFKGASIGAFGKNLGYLYTATDNIDPQSSYSIHNGGSGIEMGNMALPSSFGFNLNVKF
ncbi:SusC/RagA family TonB-linked outer membrane protein [Marinilabiliaceae bacterium JC017]|nr:SusC/RagA family TonB-linked outer membrane protein [Marinilabiliaceae bacterium JC017]